MQMSYRMVGLQRIKENFEHVDTEDDPYIEFYYTQLEIIQNTKSKKWYMRCLPQMCDYCKVEHKLGVYQYMQYEWSFDYLSHLKRFHIKMDNEMKKFIASVCGHGYIS